MTRALLTSNLDRLTEMPIGGTIIGYAHRADNSLDHDDPAPFSSQWWDLLRWYADASEDRGLTIGLQDYGIMGGVLLEVGLDMNAGRAGTLKRSHVVVRVDGYTEMDAGPSPVLHATAVRTDRPGTSVAPRGISGGRVQWSLESGEWSLGVVVVEPARLQGQPSGFDPLHADAGRMVIDRFYQQFEIQLGNRLGRSFTMFFQDELDLGIRMPMWNSDVDQRLNSLGHTTADVDKLWVDAPDAEQYRLDYTDVVVGLLSERFFAPIAAWMDSHAVLHLMDQMSRGDLRLGASVYGDFLRTMCHFSAPGHDDPDVHGSRNVVGAVVSASIAARNGSRVVPVEAFHSSGWGVGLQTLRREVNALFGLGMTHLVLHGLYATTRNGEWEWAPPDFHFRQPWWRHSAPSGGTSTA